MHVPEGWKKAKLAEKLIVLKDGTHFSPQSKSGSFMYLTSKNIRFGKLDLNNISYISEEEHNKIYKGSPVKHGDVLLTKDGANTGNAAINSLEFEFSLLSSVAFLRGKSGILLNNFLLHLLLSPIGQSFIKSEMAGQAITRLTLQKIGGLIFSFPPYPEQQKIAQILSTWDKAIEKLEALIAAKQKRKKALMQQLLTGKKRFAGFEGEWEKMKLIEVAQFRRGSFPQPYGLPEWYDEANGLPFIQVYDIDKNMKLKPTTKNKISKLAEGKSVFIKTGTIIVSLQGSIGRVAITQYDAYLDRTVLLFQNFLVPTNNVFFAYILQELFELEKEKAPGGTIKTITKEVLSNFIVRMPHIQEQQKIASVLTAADTEIQTHEKQLSALKQQKKGLMQQLLTGKKRVKLEEAA